MVLTCKNCAYCWADIDLDDGTPISSEYCHYDGPDNWAPCEIEDKGNGEWD